MPTTDTELIRVDNVSKRFVIHKEKSLKERVVNFGRSRRHRDDFWALRDIDLSIHSGSTIGLIGPNGSGKSTLLKVVGGILQPTNGSVTLRGRLAALLELGAGFHPDLTGRENVYLNAAVLGITKAQTDRYFDAIVDFSGIEPFIDTQVKFYSSGMYVRLAFAVAVHVDPDILLVDEVLAVGDEPFQRKCMDRIRGFQYEGRTIVLVTHGLDVVADLCDRAVVLDHGRMLADGPPEEALPVLRAEFAATREEELEKRRASDPEDDELRPSQAEIVNVTLADGHGDPLTKLRFGDDLVITAEIEAKERVEDWIMGVSIDSNLGQVIFGTTNEMLGVPFDSLEVGRTVVQFRIRNVGLADGEYGITPAIAGTNRQEMDRKTKAVEFAATSGVRGVGFVSYDTSVDSRSATS